MNQPTVQRRVTALFQAMPYTPIPRDALRTIAGTEGDPIRRSRQDSHAGDPLDGLIVLSRQWGGNNVLNGLGLAPLRVDEFMAVPRADLKLVPDTVWDAMKANIRARYRV
jgi:hypothetical protein